MRDDIVPEHEPLSKMALTQRLCKAGVKIHTGWTLNEITDEGANCRDKEGQSYKLEVNTVILATGLRARREIVEEFKGLPPEVYFIGDCVKARKIYNCFEDAWRTALII